MIKEACDTIPAGKTAVLGFENAIFAERREQKLAAERVPKVIKKMDLDKRVKEAIKEIDEMGLKKEK